MLIYWISAILILNLGIYTFFYSLVRSGEDDYSKQVAREMSDLNYFFGFICFGIFTSVINLIRTLCSRQKN